MASCSRLLERWIFVVGAACACAPTASSPRETLTSFREAYTKRDVDAVWGLLSPEARAHTSREALARTLAAPDPDEARDLEAASAAAARAPVLAEAGDEEHRFVFVWLDSERRWALRTSPLDAFDLSTPRRALWAFLHAVERQRWDVLLSLAPAARRAELTSERLRELWTGPEGAPLRALLPAVRAALGASTVHPVFDLGLEAHFPFGSHGEVFLVKEDGLWRIEEIEEMQVPPGEAGPRSAPVTPKH